VQPQRIPYVEITNNQSGQVFIIIRQFVRRRNMSVGPTSCFQP